MNTIVYMIRHAESLYVAGEERTRGLSEQGKQDALRIREILRNEPIDGFVSSPYERAVQTLKPLADMQQKEILLVEALRERAIGEFGEQGFRAAKQQVYADAQFAFAGGESSSLAQARGIQALERLLEEYANKTIALGTHGDIMTLMLNYFEPQQYDYEFWQAATMPDVYRVEFEDGKLARVRRDWTEGCRASCGSAD
ncbi:bifunctional RNase H/acid phosphatase [compost metagenome]